MVGYKEIKGDEYVLNLNSLGLSLIDDRHSIELLNFSITSSSINWGEKLNNKVKVFKAFPVHISESIEEQYQKYLESTNNQEGRLTSSKSFYSVGGGDEVNLNFNLHKVCLF